MGRIWKAIWKAVKTVICALAVYSAVHYECGQEAHEATPEGTPNPKDVVENDEAGCTSVSVETGHPLYANGRQPDAFSGLPPSLCPDKFPS